jgi:hypothetical protein
MSAEYPRLMRPASDVCLWLNCPCRVWPPIRRVMSTGERYTLEALRSEGNVTWYEYRYLGTGTE